MLALRRRGLISSSRRLRWTSEDTRPARSMRKVPSPPKSICRPSSNPARSTPSPRRTARISSTSRACATNICRCVTIRRPEPYPQAVATCSATMRTRPSTATFLRRRSSLVNRQPSSSTPSGSPGGVTGAYDLAPITAHDLNRFERYSVPDAKFEARLPELFPAFLEAARRLDLAHVSLMFQPEHNLVGVLTAAAREGRRAPRFEAVRLSADALALRGSASEAWLTELGARKIFDRTSLNLAIWLPLSERAGGAPAIWPNSPPIPAPGVEHLGGAQPRAA